MAFLNFWLVKVIVDRALLHPATSTGATGGAVILTLTRPVAVGAVTWLILRSFALSVGLSFTLGQDLTNEDLIFLRGSHN